MFNKKTTTFLAIADKFTKEFSDYSESQRTIVEKQEALEAQAKQAKEAAKAEQQAADNAVKNLSELLGVSQ
jgi:hypothetical protein